MIFLIAGSLHNIIEDAVHTTFANEESVYLQDVEQYIDLVKPSFKAVMIIDEGVRGSELEVEERLLSLINYIDKNFRSAIPVWFLTRDYALYKRLAQQQFKSAKIYFSQHTRVPICVYQMLTQQLTDQFNIPQKDTLPKLDDDKNLDKKGFGFLKRFIQREKKDQLDIKPTDDMEKEYNQISKGLSRVLAVTGHRGSGITSTTVNLAYTAQRRGLSVILVDMDIDYRSTNLYFNNFYESAQRDEEIASSLIRSLAKPQHFKTTAFNVKDDFWLTTLSYSFEDKRLIESFYSCQRFINMISILRQQFNLVLIDMPMDIMSKFSEALLQIDAFGLCIPNNVYSALCTIRGANKELSPENLAYLNAKSKIVVTKYNDKARIQGEPLGPARLSRLVSEVSDSFDLEMSVAGHVPYGLNFDSQIEQDIPLVISSEEYQKVYGDILLRLMEGAKR